VGSTTDVSRTIIHTRCFLGSLMASEPAPFPAHLASLRMPFPAVQYAKERPDMLKVPLSEILMHPELLQSDPVNYQFSEVNQCSVCGTLGIGRAARCVARLG
jgi:hypothetical protein